MAVFATKLNTNYFSLTDATVDATSKLVTNNFVKQAYAWLKSEGFTFITGRVSNQMRDFVIDAYAEAEFSNILASVTLHHTPADTVGDI